jgi:hypothetical protein
MAIVAVVVLVTSIAAYAASFLDIRLATVTTSSSQQKVDKATLLTRASIPRDGSAEAFGYGIITNQGVLIVTTTDKGVLDSEAQKGDANNPVFHNHYVTLRAKTTSLIHTQNQGDVTPMIDNFILALQKQK